MNCAVCNEPMDPAIARSGSHPACFPFAELDEEDPFVAVLKTKLIDVIQWGYQQNPRNNQVAIGPSEMGVACDRRIAYRLADVPRCNTDMDPWPMIVGTAMHGWLEQSFNAWNLAHGDEKWLTEQKVKIDEVVQGSSDLYSMELRAVIDWKGVGPDVMRKIRKEGPPPMYLTQIQLYGYGFSLMGFPVDKVCLAFMSRAGWLKDMYVHCDDYDPGIAEAAIARVYGIATDITRTNVLIYPDRWNQISAVPTNDCGWCPWYDPSRSFDADNTGCPGR